MTVAPRCVRVVAGEGACMQLHLCRPSVGSQEEPSFGARRALLNGRPPMKGPYGRLRLRPEASARPLHRSSTLSILRWSLLEVHSARELSRLFSRISLRESPDVSQPTSA